MKTRVKGRWVIGWNAETQSHTIIDDGEVVYEGDHIIYVGKYYESSVDKVVNATNCLISPGFINSHCVMDLSIVQYGFDRPREEGMYRPRSWLTDPTMKPVFNAQEIQAGADHNLLSVVRSGATTFCGITAMVFKRWDDPEWEPEVYKQAAVKYGLRAYLSHHFRDFSGYLEPDGTAAQMHNERQGRLGLERNIAFIRKNQGTHDDTIRGLIFPYTLDQNSAELLQEARKASRELGVGIRLHFAQSAYELQLIWERYRATPIEHLYNLGFLDNDVLLTHCLYVAGNYSSPYPDGRELKLLGSKGVSVCNTPWIYADRAGYLNGFGRYQKAGINMMIGTDAFPQDILLEARWALIMGKFAGQSAMAVTAPDVYNAITVNAAKYLGRDDIGRLTPGAKADITMVDFDRVTIGPTDDPIRSLIYYGSANDVQSVVINGKTVVEGFKAVGVDEAEVVRRAQPVTDKLKQTLVDWDWARRPAETRFPPSFPRL